MSRWTHAACGVCFSERHPDVPNPSRVATGEVENCCYCGKTTALGLYDRNDPEQTPCKGEHEDS
jgi:hypothetical protein